MSVTVKWYKTRWLLPLLFIVGYMATYSKLEGFELEYLVWTLLCISACCLLLTRLGPPFHTKLPIWIFLSVFIISYYIKLYWIAIDPDILGDNFYLLNIYDLTRSSAALLKWFNTISCAFVTFCIVSWYLLHNLKYTTAKVLLTINNINKAVVFLLILILSLIFVTSYVMYIYGIGRMAADNEYLPFRLAGWIFNFQVTLIPALILLLIWFSDENNLNIYFTVGIMLLVLNGIIGMVMRSSRGFLLQLFIMLMILFMATGRINGKRLKMFASVIIITILLIPYISFYRTIRAENISIPISSLLAEVVENTSGAGSESFFKSLKAGSFFMLARFTGAESLLHVLGSDSQALSFAAFSGTISVTRYFTINVVGFPEEAIHSEAPSALGWFYLVGGIGLVVIGTLFATIFTWICWCSIAKLSLLCLPVAQTLFLSWFFIIFIEGTLDGQFVPILVITGSIIVCEFILRVLTGLKLEKSSL